MRDVRRKIRRKVPVWALVVALLLKTGMMPQMLTVSAAVQTETLTIDFEDGDGGFTGRGAASVLITDENAYSGNCMLVSEGTKSWNGAERDLSDVVSGNAVLTVSAYVRNNEEYEITSHMTLQEEKEDGTTEYNWIQGEVMIAPGEWKQLSGTIVVNPETVKPVLYFETKEVGVSFSIDQIELTIETEIEDAPDPEFDIAYTKGQVIDFEDNQIYFDSFGDVRLSITEEAGYKKSKGLLVEGRTRSYEGPLKDVSGLLEEGMTLPGTSVSAAALVKNQAEAGRWIAITLRLTKADGTQEYQNLAWVEAEAESWVQLLSHTSYIIGEDVIEAAIYIEAEGEAPFIVDQVNLIAETVEESPNNQEEPVAPFDEMKIDFEDGELWFTNWGDGIGTIVFDSYGGERALAVTGRTLNWHGVKRDLSGAALAGKGLEISFWGKNTSSYPVDIYLTLQETNAEGIVTYTRIAGGEVLPETWTELEGSVNIQPGTAQVIIYFEASDSTGTFVIDEVMLRTTKWIEEPQKAPVYRNEEPSSGIIMTETPVVEPSVVSTPKPASVTPFSRLLIDFEDGDAFFGNRGDGTGIITKQAHGGSRALFVTGRTLSWHGVERDFTNANLQGNVLQVSFWTKHEKSEIQEIRLSIMEENADGEITYNWIAGQNGIKAGEWVQITGEYLVSEDAEKIILYFEATDPYVSFLIDDIELKVAAPETAVETDEKEEAETESVWVKNVGDIYIETEKATNVWQWIGAALVISAAASGGFFLRKRRIKRR